MDGSMMKAALAIKSASAITEHLQSVEHVQRMATTLAKDNIAEVRDEILENQNATLEKQLALVQELVTKQEVFMKQVLDGQQQLVTRVIGLVDFFKRQLETTVGTDNRESKTPKHMVIKHSDGTASTIEFNGSRF